MNTKFFLLVVLILLQIRTGFSQVVHEGIVEDIGLRKPLSGVLVSNESVVDSTFTDEEGQFRLFSKGEKNTFRPCLQFLTNKFPQVQILSILKMPKFLPKVQKI